jgi:kynurenine formamidase
MPAEWYPSRWGKNDELGAMNLLTAEKIASAVKLVKRGKVFNLSHILEEGMPVNWFHSDFLYFTYRDIRSAAKQIRSLNPNTNKVSFMNIRMEMSDHTGTHIDALNHATIDGRMYNGNDSEKISTSRGTTRLGVETIPSLVSRGVLADMTLLGKESRRYAIKREELQKVLNIEGVSLRPADTLLIYTGWENLWKKDREAFVSSMPGIGVQAARWIASVGAVAVGSDTQSVEVEPNENRHNEGIVHQILLAKNGIHLIENLLLSELVKSKVYEFLFICLPLRIKGATGSPVSPVAVI